MNNFLEALKMENSDYNQENKWIERNKKARILEETDIYKAIDLYELNVIEGTKLPQTFIRLYKLYRKQKDFENEIRICDIAINRIGNKEEKYNSRWFSDRKLKAICLRDNFG